MFVNGRGSIAQVVYSGDEAAAEIKKLLDAVVRTPTSFRVMCTHADFYGRSRTSMSSNDGRRW